MEVLRDWLPASGMQYDARPMFAYYPTNSGFDPETGVFDCDICVLVAASSNYTVNEDAPRSARPSL